MGYLSREQILAADDRTYADVPVPEWGGSVRVRSMTGRERDQLERSVMVEKKRGLKEVNMENFRAKIVALTVVDESGELLFTERDVRALGEKSSKAVARIANKASELSAITDDDVEEMTEDFDEAPSDGSGSA